MDLCPACEKGYHRECDGCDCFCNDPEAWTEYLERKGLDEEE